MAKKKQAAGGVPIATFAALTTFSDLMTLLLTLFVLLFALSEPKSPKMAATMSAMRQRVQRTPHSPPAMPAIRPQKTNQTELSVLRRGPPGKRSEVKAMVENENQKMIIGGDGFFRPGSAELSAQAKRLIQHDIAPDLKGFNNRIEVLGHAERSGDNAESWDLSFARAHAVMRFLVDECGISENRFRIISSSDNEPRDPGNPSANRRVEIIMTDFLVKGTNSQ